MVEIALLAVLTVVLALVAAGMLWQERVRPAEPSDAVVYGVEDAVAYVWDRLSPQTRADLGRGDVRRILEWELHFLQQPKLRDRPAVLGGTEAAQYVQDRAYEAGYSYEPGPIFAVLDLQAEYLAELGAVGEAAADDVDG